MYGQYELFHLAVQILKAGAIKSPGSGVYYCAQAEGSMESLGKRLAAGEPSALAELYELCAARIYHYLALRLGSRDAADEVLQEVFVRLVRQRQKLGAIGNLLAYAFAIARNEANRHASKQFRQKQKQRPLAAEELFCFAADETELRETAAMVAAALQELPDELREVIELKIYAGLTFREIAELLAVPQGTVATRYRTALARLKEWFARQMS